MAAPRIPAVQRRVADRGRPARRAASAPAAVAARRRSRRSFSACSSSRVVGTFERPPGLREVVARGSASRWPPPSRSGGAGALPWSCSGVACAASLAVVALGGINVPAAAVTVALYTYASRTSRANAVARRDRRRRRHDRGAHDRRGRAARRDDHDARGARLGDRARPLRRHAARLRRAAGGAGGARRAGARGARRARRRATSARGSLASSTTSSPTTSASWSCSPGPCDGASMPADASAPVLDSIGADRPRGARPRCGGCSACCAPTPRPPSARRSRAARRRRRSPSRCARAGSTSRS